MSNAELIAGVPGGARTGYASDSNSETATDSDTVAVEVDQEPTRRPRKRLKSLRNSKMTADEYHTKMISLEEERVRIAKLESEARIQYYNVKTEYLRAKLRKLHGQDNQQSQLSSDRFYRPPLQPYSDNLYQPYSYNQHNVGQSISCQPYIPSGVQENVII